MGNYCNCMSKARVMAWDDDNDDDWGLMPVARRVSMAENSGGGTRVKIRMTKGQLRRLLASAGGEDHVEDVVAEVMRMGSVRVDVVVAELRRVAAAERRQQHPPPNKLETIQEDLDE